jgi:hypothetical protein
MRIAYAMGVLCLGVAAGCANFATLQTAETMKKGKFELGVGATFTSYRAEIETERTQTDPATGAEVTRAETESTTFTVPAVTVSGRYGLTERLELHGIAWLPFGASVGGKYMVVGDHEQPGFVLSPGLDVSVPMSLTVDGESSILVDLYVPLHMGYRASDGFEVYWTPKYLLRRFDGELGHAAGGSVGVALGAQTTFMVEASVLYDISSDSPIINVGVGVGFE